MSQLQAEYNAYKSTIQRLEEKITEVQLDSEEHRLVLDTLKDCDGDRRCMRMIGGVLLDKTVADVRPSLEETQAALLKMTETLLQQLKDTETKLEDWKKKHNVKIVAQ